MIVDILFRRKYLTTCIILFVAVILLVIGLISFNSSQPKPGQITESLSEENWVTYSNEEYDFEISFPKEWKLNEDFSDELSPKINIYKPRFKIGLPLDTYSSETNVSIFPKGLPSKEIIGQTQTVDFGIEESTDRSVDYLLSNGQTWSSFVSFTNPPETWKKWGFIWLNTEINNLEYVCQRNDIQVSLDECNTFNGDTFIRKGTINTEDRSIQLNILKSFTFIE